MPVNFDVFLRIPPESWVASNPLAFAIRDQYPVSPGHTLVIPRRLVPTWFDATPDEQLALMSLVDEVRRQLDAMVPRPDGYNVGFNAGPAAGQTVMHLHVHVIPRFLGDMDDPRGGVRHVIPHQGNYVARAEPLATGGRDPFARHVLPLLDRADQVAIVAAFVQQSGLDRIEASLETALRRGARVRLVTGDYLDLTQVAALETLLDWQTSWRAAEDAVDDATGTFETRVVEVDRLPGPTRTFHPKSWHLEGPAFGVAFVGSSNLSRAALESGIEWNLRVDRDRDRPAWTRIREAFEDVWTRARPLDAPWVDAYARRARARPLRLPPGEIEIEALPDVPDPHEVQRGALAALNKARAEGRRRSLVVLATGLGKTWLAAFDYRQLWDDLGRAPRLLFLAHRREILLQAARTFRTVVRERDPSVRVGWCLEERAELDADLVFASVAKLSRATWLERLKASRPFDYVVVDEVHHAAADSYRRILSVLDPAFLLGLTATPDRADAADVVGLFDDHVAFRADIARGIGVGRLVPFRYYGLKDDVDYKAIPWRNARFAPEELAAAVQTERRMETLWKAWGEHPGARTLVFCCGVAHVDYAAAWLASHGVRVAKVYTAPGSDDREDALIRLAAGDLDAICAIDVFNEGVDVPALDRVVLLRPTESGVVFLQQLGRGLRAADGKDHLTVIDFVGNHRVFLERLRTLVSLGDAPAGESLTSLVARGHVDLPEGCSVDVEVEAKPLLEALFRVGGADEVERAYRQLRESRGRRPSAGELFRMGFLPSSLRKRHQSWFAWVGGEGDLTADEARAYERAAGFLDDLEIEAMTKAYKMVTLEALLDAGALATGLTVRDLATRAWTLLRRSPELLADVPEDERLPDEPSEADLRRWTSYWRRNPVDAWTSAKKRGRTWFRLVDDAGVRFLPAFDVDPALTGLIAELVDYRLAQYRRRTPSSSADGFVCKVTWNQRDPILKLPSARAAGFPQGEADVRLPDGSVWLFRFAKEFCNVARPAGTDVNRLPELLRGWFGPNAGQPGTAFQVRFVASPDGLWVEPVQPVQAGVVEGSNVLAFPPRCPVTAYPDLRAAAGHAGGGVDVPEASTVLLPVDDDVADRFAVRVAGTSMDGGRSPLRDGDWAVLRLARGTSAEANAGRVVLVELPSAVDGHGWVLKRLQRADRGWRLVSDNPDGPVYEATDDMNVVARLERAVRPEDVAPSLGTRLSADELPAAFGIPDLSATSGRHGGHLFLVLGDGARLVAPDRLTSTMQRRPGETAYVLAAGEDGVRYLGVARWTPDEEAWALPEVDFVTWRAFAEGREVSRRLPDGALATAQRVVDGLMALPEAERVLTQANGRRARILGTAQRGGLRIDVGTSPRTVSLLDIAWVSIAAEDVRARGGLLDEARVNHLRYLEGTPKGSTRWIDTGWALAAWALGASLVDTAPRTSAKPRRADGTVIDATFRVETVEGKLTVVLEARGGTRGTPQAQNTEYTEGLRAILERLARAGLRLDDAAVETRQTAELPLDLRRLDLGQPYPIDIRDPEGLRRAMGSAQEKVGRPAGARGGNPTRRIRLYVGGTGLSADVLARFLEADSH